MTNLTKKLYRKTSAIRFEKSKHRHVILSLEPTARLGVRLEGTRQTYKIDAEVVYEFAVRVWMTSVERRARQLIKAGMKARSARSQARKELSKELK